jgi:hypothetical protein
VKITIRRTDEDGTGAEVEIEGNGDTPVLLKDILEKFLDPDRYAISHNYKKGDPNAEVKEGDEIVASPKNVKGA